MEWYWSLAASLALAVAASAAAAAELLFVSFGILGAIALGCGVGAVMLAFQVHPIAGWAMLALAPVGIWYALAWALRRMRSGVGTVQAEISSDAGYSNEAQRLGVAAGAVGELVTDALPTGRARFPQGELDVSVQGSTLPRHARVRVIRVDGPVVLVVSA